MAVATRRALFSFVTTIRGSLNCTAMGRSRMIDRSDQNASATIRLSDGRVLVVLGTDIVAYDPLD